METVRISITTYRSEIESMVDILLVKFVEGIFTQRGAIFGFEPNSNNDTGPLLKICNVSDEDMKDLDCVPKDNICYERSVGFFGYELGVRGKTQFEKCSGMMTII